MRHRAVAVLIVFSFAVIPCSADPFTVVLTRFGPCSGVCQTTITDTAGTGVIDFSASVGEPPGGVFAISGIATQTITTDSTGRVTGILMSLTDTTLQGSLGGIGSPPIIGGQIDLISSVPFASIDGVSGFASLSGQYRSFRGGVIGSADLNLHARLGGVLLGLVDGGTVTNASSPVGFAGADSRSFPFPVDNLLFGIFNFGVTAGDGFVLPASGEVSVGPVPEPSSFAFFALVSITFAFVDPGIRKYLVGRYKRW